MKTFYVYMLTNSKLKPIYVGMTNSLERRVYEHKNKLTKGFTSKYHLDKLIYWEECQDVISIIEREKQIEFAFEGKRWFDLIRTKRAIDLVPSVTQPYQMLFPVPLSEILANPNINVEDQNEGY